MHYEFRRIDPENAQKVVSWSYESPYQDYGLQESELESFLEEKNNFFVGLSNNKLFGFISFGIDGRVEGGNYDENYMDVGVGLAPESTGKGLGLDFLLQGLLFGAKLFKTKCFRVTIASFNKRAQKVCQRLGFVEKEKFLRASDRTEFIIFILDNIVREPAAGDDAAVCLNSSTNAVLLENQPGYDGRSKQGSHCT